MEHHYVKKNTSPAEKPVSVEEMCEATHSGWSGRVS